LATHKFRGDTNLGAGITADCENTIHNQDFKTLVDLFTSYAEHCCMEYIQAHNRSQIRMNCLEAQIASDNQVRVLDAFVEQLELVQLGYQIPLLVFV
jgi:hypothetical protein